VHILNKIPVYNNLGFEHILKLLKIKSNYLEKPLFFHKLKILE